MSASTKTWNWNERLKRRITLRRWEAGKKRKYLCQGQKRNICVGTKAISKKLNIIKYTRILLICLATVRPANTERKWMNGCLCLQCWLWQCLKCLQCLQWGMIRRKTCQWCRLWRWQSKARQVRDRPPTRPSLCKFQFLWQICQNITSSTKFGREDPLQCTDESNVSLCRQSWITIIYFLRFVQFSEKLIIGFSCRSFFWPVFIWFLLQITFTCFYWFLLQITIFYLLLLVSPADHFFDMFLFGFYCRLLLPVFIGFFCRSLYLPVFIGFSCRSLHPPE